MLTLLRKVADLWQQLKLQNPLLAKITKWFIGIAVPLVTAFVTGLLQWTIAWINKSLFLGALLVAPTNPTVAQELEENDVLIDVVNVNSRKDTLIRHDMKVSLESGTYQLGLVDNRSSKAMPMPSDLSSFSLNGAPIHTIRINPLHTQLVQIDYRPAGFLKVAISGEAGHRQIHLRLASRDVRDTLDKPVPPYVLKLPKGSFDLTLLLGGEPFNVSNSLIEISPHDTIQLEVPIVTIQGRVTRGSDVGSRAFDAFMIKVENRQSQIKEDGTFQLEGLPWLDGYGYEIVTKDGQHFKNGTIFNTERKTRITIGQGENITI